MKKAYLAALGAILTVVLVFALEPGGVQGSSHVQTCVVNIDASPTPGTYSVTIEGTRDTAEYQMPVAAVLAACAEAAGSATFRDAVATIAASSRAGSFKVLVRRNIGSVFLGREFSGGVKLDAKDIERAPQHMAGSQANIDLIVSNLYLELLVHEIIGAARSGHNHSTIIPAVNTVLADLQKDYQRQVRSCGDKLVKWVFPNPTPEKTVLLNVRDANSGSFAADCPVGGIAQLPEVDAATLRAKDSSALGTGIRAGVIAGAAIGSLALGSAAWYARRRWLRAR